MRSTSLRPHRLWENSWRRNGIRSRDLHNTEIACSKAISIVGATTYVKGLPALAVLSCLLVFWINRILWTPSRTYNREKNTVGNEYDAWTREGILEYYWGEHIHLGYYNDAERKMGYKRKNFIQAKYDFIDEMAKFAGIGFETNDKSLKILDVGCGIGGTSRYLERSIGDKATVTGITLSPNQVERATSLAKDRGINNVNFQVMDALNMDFPDNSFDVVWACESGEHMPDKKRYVDEMARVLKPGGRIVIATWYDTLCSSEVMKIFKLYIGVKEMIARNPSVRMMKRCSTFYTLNGLIHILSP